MIKLAIRDDDANYFTKVEDLVCIYKEIEYFPISYAVVPYVTDVLGGCPDTKGNKIPQFVGNNMELVSWLKNNLATGTCDVLLHGITHEYKFEGDQKIAEMVWRSDPNLKEEIGRAKSSLEQTIDHGVTVFVAPSNKITRYGIECVSANGLNFSGIVPISFQRPFTLKNLGCYLKRWSYRFKDKLPYPNILHYTGHIEINACALQGYDYLVQMFNYCEKINSPMVVNVHYWHLRDFPQKRRELVDFVKYAMDHGAAPTTLSELLK